MMASVLCRTLLETNQEIPEFLEMYAPEGEARENPKFEVESDFDPNDVAGAGESGGWGATDAPAASSGWDSFGADANDPAVPSGW